MIDLPDEALWIHSACSISNIIAVAHSGRSRRDAGAWGSGSDGWWAHGLPEGAAVWGPGGSKWNGDPPLHLHRWADVDEAISRALTPGICVALAAWSARWSYFHDHPTPRSMRAPGPTCREAWNDVHDLARAITDEVHARVWSSFAEPLGQLVLL